MECNCYINILDLQKYLIHQGANKIMTDVPNV